MEGRDSVAASVGMAAGALRGVDMFDSSFW